MNRHRPSAAAGSAPRLSVLLFACATLFAAAQTPAPPVPPLSKEEKAAAAAIEAPKTVTPPPLPGQLQTPAPAKVAAPALPPSAPDASASKMQALEALTQKPDVTPAPSVSAPADKAPITSSTSSSRQFIVHGKVFQTRSAMSGRCDEIAAELRKVLNDKEPWVLPIVVLLNTGEEAAKSKGPLISTAITELTHGGFHLQVTINERPGLTAEELQKEVVRALLAERVLRNHQKITTPEGRLLLPDWIMTGVLHAMAYRASARPSAMFATIFRSGKIYGIEEIIEASPVEMDSLSRSIYETSCCALVLALVDQPGGPERFNKFLNALASDPRSERELLDAAFPSFAASASSLNKWWALQLAQLSKPGVAEPFTAAESLKAIEEAITIRYAALPAEVPQNVKPRPFVLPAPLSVAPAAPKPAPQVAAVAPDAAKPKATANPDTASAEEEATEEEKPRRSLLRRLLFLGDPKPDEEADQPAVAENMPATQAAEPDKTAPAEEEDKPGFFGRLFGGGTDEKKSEAKDSAPAKAAAIEKPALPAANAKEQTVEKQEPVAKAAAVEKPAPPAKAKEQAAEKTETEAKEEKKPSVLNPLNWFRGDKKPAKDKTDEKPVDEEQAAAFPPPSVDVTRLIAPSLADAWQWLAPAAPQPAIEPLFGYRKSKPKPEDNSKAGPKQEDAPAKAAAKPESNPDSKPRTTSPAKKTTAKPAETPRSSKPAPAPTPAATSTPTGKSGLVPVTLPLEEYQHILKREDRAQILNHNVATLRALELRVSVLFRPVVTAYLAAVIDLQEGKTKDMDKRLAVLREFALVAYQKSVAVRDYLDWFEASEGGALSGKFDDFLNLPQIIQQELPPRTDPISKYLDAIDKEFSQ